MHKQDKNQYGFGSFGIIMTVAIVALVGTIGAVIYASSRKNDANTNSTTGTTTQSSTKSEAKGPCSDGETSAATNGTFCSADIGVKFTVPSIFKGKLTKVDNYDVYQGPVDQQPGQKAGTSELVFNASITGNDNYTITIAKEPLRTGYNGTYQLQNAYFEKDTRILSQLASTPINTYDSKTDTTKVTGSYTLGDPVPPVNIDGVRFYKMQNGDAGFRSSMYLGVIKNKIIKIELKASVFMGDPADDPSTLYPDTVFTGFEAAVEKLDVL